MLKKNWNLALSLFVFIALFLWWSLLKLLPSLSTTNNVEMFAASYGIMALVGGVFGFYTCKKLGGFNNIIGKFIGFLSLGLLAQEFGQLAYSYYSIVLGVEVPYPSVGDIGFYGSMFLYILGAYYLVKFCTARITANKLTIEVNPFVVVIPLAMLAVSYLVFLKDYVADFSNLLVTILDFSAPLIQSIYVSLALIAYFYTKNIANSTIHKSILFLLFALVFQYVSDFVFLYKANRDLYVTAGVTDLMYLISYFLMTFAIIKLHNVFEQSRSAKIDKDK